MLGNVIKNRRQELGLTIKELAQLVKVDSSLLSRIEKGERSSTKVHLLPIAEALNLPYADVLKQWLEDKVLGLLVEYSDIAHEVLMAAESRVEYLTSSKALEIEKLPKRLVEKLKVIDDLKNQWERRKPDFGLQLEKLEEIIGIEYTYESNRIEGNTLSLQETFLVVEQGLTIAGKTMQEHLEAINHTEAIEFIRELTTRNLDLNEYRLKQIHHLVLKGIDRKNAGQYRQVGVRIGGSKHVPPEPYMLAKLMEDYLHHYERQKSFMHPVILAAEMHERLVTIHPFIDGNGRTSRLVMNLILLKHGYTIANLKGSLAARLNYYKALEGVQINNNPELFYELIIDAVHTSLVEHLNLV
jgi:Fic family protein/DNA-binding XRE family transcriptional regulator